MNTTLFEKYMNNLIREVLDKDTDLWTVTPGMVDNGCPLLELFQNWSIWYFNYFLMATNEYAKKELIHNKQRARKTREDWKYADTWNDSALRNCLSTR